MKKSHSCLASLVLLVIALSSSADQLAWNEQGISEKGAKAIKPNSLLVSYCSLANNHPVEVWLVEKTEVVATEDKRFHQIKVSGRRLFRSVKRFSPGEYAEPADYQAFPADDKSAILDEKIDLAYVYAPANGNSFQCLGKTLKLDCTVEVETISLSEDIHARASKAVKAAEKPAN